MPHNGTGCPHLTTLAETLWLVGEVPDGGQLRAEEEPAPRMLAGKRLAKRFYPSFLGDLEVAVVHQLERSRHRPVSHGDHA